MSPRSRHPRNRQLPDNLRERNGLYSYRNPLNGKERGLGRDKLAAIKWARQANDAVRKITGEVSPEAWVLGETARTWGEWLTRYEQILAQRKLAEKTRVNYAGLMGKARAEWPADRGLQSIDVAAVGTAVKSLVDVGKSNTAKHYRQFLVDCFGEAITEGWITFNPAEASRQVVHHTKRARLELDVLQRILAGKLTVWMRNAILLAVVSGQRREDVCMVQRRDIREGHWWLEQHKTANYANPMRLAIPLSLRLDVLGVSLQDVVDACKATGVLSHHLIHQTRHMERSKRGDPLHLATITRGFQEAVKRLGIDWKDRTPPSFHELRSLSKRLYDAQGGVDTKQLLGHASEANAALYAGTRGGWVKLKV